MGPASRLVAAVATLPSGMGEAGAEISKREIESPLIAAT